MHQPTPVFSAPLDAAAGRVEMFAPMFGIQEDPATGGASGLLGAYALTTGIVTAEESAKLVSLQGVSSPSRSRSRIPPGARHSPTRSRNWPVRKGPTLAGTVLSVGEGEPRESMTRPQKFMTGVAITGLMAVAAAVVVLWMLFSALGR